MAIYSAESQGTALAGTDLCDNFRAVERTFFQQHHSFAVQRRLLVHVFPFPLHSVVHTLILPYTEMGREKADNRLEKTFFQVISYQQFKHFLFFSFGAWIRARYVQLTQLSKEGFWKLLLVATPFLMLLIHHFHIPRVDFMTEWVFSLSGITLILLLFKGLSTSFENNKVGRCLSFIGRRSLDIYLLHFFILPSLHPLGRFFTETGNQVLEICLVTGIAIMIIAVCLLISHILRQSDILAKLLFGKADKIGG